MTFSKPIDDYFRHVMHHGKCEMPCISLLHGQPDRSQVHLSVKRSDEGYQARFLASGGVVLIACCEHWARMVEQTQVMELNVESCMRQLSIDSKWRADVVLLAQAAERLARLLDEINWDKV